MRRLRHGASPVCLTRPTVDGTPGLSRRRRAVAHTATRPSGFACVPGQDRPAKPGSGRRSPACRRAGHHQDELLVTSAVGGMVRHQGVPATGRQPARASLPGCSEPGRTTTCIGPPLWMRPNAATRWPRSNARVKLGRPEGRSCPVSVPAVANSDGTRPHEWALSAPRPDFRSVPVHAGDRSARRHPHWLHRYRSGGPSCTTRSMYAGRTEFLDQAVDGPCPRTASLAPIPRTPGRLRESHPGNGHRETRNSGRRHHNGHAGQGRTCASCAGLSAMSNESPSLQEWAAMLSQPSVELLMRDDHVVVEEDGELIASGSLSG
jgi:hypothetical protein